MKYLINKILEKINNNNDIKYDEYKYDWKYLYLLDLINETITKELMNSNGKKEKIKKLLYKCKWNEKKINGISEDNSNSINIGNEYYYLFSNCLSEIKKINEIYKYIIHKNGKKQEELLCKIINPFIDLFNRILKDYKKKFPKLKKETWQSKKNEEGNKFKICSFRKNEYLNIYEIREEKYKSNKFKGILSNFFEEIYEENNFYFYKGEIIANKFIILDDEFKK